ncbi:hypothetical protein [Halalkalicoccus salilacus]|uniref:hypothetical protein n=1 Tax=Halalkalicoccus salilacus TaxID=3117459 RepID=UPI00300F1E97
MGSDANDLSNQDQDKIDADEKEDQNEEEESIIDAVLQKPKTLLVESSAALLDHGRSSIGKTQEWFSKKRANTSCQDIVNHSITSAVIGGLLFPLVAPFFMPIITDFQVNSEMVSGPEIEFEADPGSGQEETENISFWFRNKENRIAQDVTIDIWYRGCSVDRDISHGPERVGRTPGVELTRNNCLESIYLPNLPPGGEILARYTYDTTEVPYHSEQVEEGEITLWNGRRRDG